MKRIHLIITLFLLFLWQITAESNATTLEYYFGTGETFRKEIPSPADFLGYEPGTHHTRYDQLLAYFKELDRVSEHAQLKVIGQTYGGRPLIVLVVSSVENLSRLEEIRTNHLKITDPSSNFDHSSLPTINMLGFGVHGNESSAAEAAILTAYYLLAAEGPEVQRYLENGVWFIEPSRNPDGHDRFTQWIGSQKSKNLVADPADLEHNEAYPGGRGNHYWFDLNRDWLPAIHVESRARLEFYHKWIPHIATCHHEMGTNSTFFFEPTRPVDNESPLVPRSHYELNNKFAAYFAGALNQLGSLYYTKEDFDNFNPTFGSSYPDFNGSLAILFEQGSSRGHIQERTVGVVTYPEGIRNQLAVSLASIRASVELKSELIANQKAFFRSAFENGNRSRVKGYIFGDSENQNLNLLFVDLLQRHRIEVIENDRAVRLGNQDFLPGRSFIVPTAQAQNRLVELFFNRDISVPDSVFYDGSTWTVVLAYGLPHAALANNQLFAGKRPYQRVEPVTPPLARASYAYLIPWNDHHSAAFLSQIFEKGIQPYVALQPFASQTGQEIVNFGHGTLVIPVSGQQESPEKLHAQLSALSQKFHVQVFPVETGLNVRGIDLGSRNIRPLKKPEILILTGRGISSLETGEAWYLADNYLNIPVTRADVAKLERINLNRYSTIILPGTDRRSGLVVSEAAKNRLKSWVADGGTLIAINSASSWLVQNEIVKEKLLENKPDTVRSLRLDFDSRSKTEGAKVVGGTILQIDIDHTHPIGFGFTSRKLPILKNNTVALQFSSNPYNTVAAFEAEPHISGYISKSNLELFSSSAAIVVHPVQAGGVILFTFNPIHRASWHSASRLFYNSIYFSQLINTGR